MDINEHSFLCHFFEWEEFILKNGSFDILLFLSIVHTTGFDDFFF